MVGFWPGDDLDWSHRRRRDLWAGTGLWLVRIAHAFRLLAAGRTRFHSVERTIFVMRNRGVGR